MPPPAQILRKETGTGRGRATVTTEMLREWQRLGEQRMDEAGKLDGVARQYGVASNTRKNYLRADGKLTKRAEDQLRKDGEGKDRCKLK
ncbi:hypothetical protein PHO31112_03300 [Pandoraea horticolens]|uniref:Uncharacterized protein n=1 Tax=Pandoraea horticolens TaxID=2508298 RepID=A0A5E4WI92_9BURK|nr:hypothetical protein [Pandoraea horticolens]VVE24358.1 hypothetical protein PHO31112_03300 [Pandoraea horticolens]